MIFILEFSVFISNVDLMANESNCFLVYSTRVKKCKKRGVNYYTPFDHTQVHIIPLSLM